MQKSITLYLKVSVICRAQQITALPAQGITHICLIWLSARALQNNEKTMQSNSSKTQLCQWQKQVLLISKSWDLLKLRSPLLSCLHARILGADISNSNTQWRMHYQGKPFQVLMFCIIQKGCHTLPLSNTVIDTCRATKGNHSSFNTTDMTD